MQTIKLKDNIVVTLKEEPSQRDVMAYDEELYKGISADQVKDTDAEGKATSRASVKLNPTNLANAEVRLTKMMIVSAKKGEETIEVTEDWLMDLPASQFEKIRTAAVLLKEKAEQQGNA